VQNKRNILTQFAKQEADSDHDLPEHFAQAGTPTSVPFRLQKSFNLESKEIFQDTFLIEFRGKH
jgi:hypothetical protein